MSHSETQHGEGKTEVTHLPGLSRSPPRRLWSWQQQRIYRTRPSRLKSDSDAGGSRGRLGGSSSRGPRHASISGKQPPTQWL